MRFVKISTWEKYESGEEFSREPKKVIVQQEGPTVPLCQRHKMLTRDNGDSEAGRAHSEY